MSTKILIADDHGIVRQGVTSLLDMCESFDVVAEAEDVVEALLLIRKYKPDVVVVDAGMPNLNGISGVRRILKEFPDMKIVILSELLSGEFVKGMFDAGICGYIFKDNLFDELIAAVKTVVKGDIHLSPAITGVKIDSYVKHLAEDSKV